MVSVSAGEIALPGNLRMRSIVVRHSVALCRAYTIRSRSWHAVHFRSVTAHAWAMSGGALAGYSGGASWHEATATRTRAMTLRWDSEDKYSLVVQRAFCDPVVN